MGQSEKPTWTVLYNIVNGTRWIGTGWEFFDNETEAMQRQSELNAQGHCATKRPFHESCDRPHMGAAHRM